MNRSSDSKKFLISAIIWTVAALAVLALFVVVGRPNTIGTLSGVALVGFCIVGQWMRYFKFK